MTEDHFSALKTFPCTLVPTLAKPEMDKHAGHLLSENLKTCKTDNVAVLRRIFTSGSNLAVRAVPKLAAQAYINDTT